jgi:hypothetical protein
MISRALEAEILRLYHTEHWPIGTIATQLRVHHSTVRRVLAATGMPTAQKTVRPSLVEPYLAFIVETLTKFPTLRASRLYQMVRGSQAQGRACLARRGRNVVIRAPPIISAPSSAGCVRDRQGKPICVCARCQANKPKSTGPTSASTPWAAPCAR